MEKTCRIKQQAAELSTLTLIEKGYHISGQLRNISQAEGSRYLPLLVDRLTAALEQLSETETENCALEIRISEIRLLASDRKIVRIWPEQQWIPFETFQALVVDVEKRKRAWCTPGWIITDNIGRPRSVSLGATLWLLDSLAGVNLPVPDGAVLMEIK